jgi:hypothetical protein
MKPDGNVEKNPATTYDLEIAYYILLEEKCQSPLSRKLINKIELNYLNYLL